MPQLSVQELRDDVDGVLERVESGESFTITRDGFVVAELVPYVSEERRGE